LNAIAKQEDYGAEPNDLGDAMKALPSDRWRAFVRHYILDGTIGAPGRAYAAAGFESKPEHRPQNAWRLLQDPRIIAAISEQTKRVLRVGHPLAVQVLYQIMANGEDKDKLKAAALLLERADPAQSSHRLDVVHQHVSPEDELYEEFRAMIQLGVAQEKLRQIFGGNRIPALQQRYAEEAKVINGKVDDESSSTE
jgi:hypothetical protein